MKFYSKLFSIMYDPVMHPLENKILSEKRKFLLKDVNSNVLEIGAGTGANFPFYQSFSKIVIIEKNEFMIQRLKQKNYNFDIEYYVASIEDKNISVKLPEFPSIVSTLVLCSVKNLEQAIQNLYQLLDKDGTLYVIEHIVSSNKFYRSFQNTISPIWKIIGDGCNINRNTDQVLKKYFRPLYEEYFFAGVDFYLAKLKKIND